MVRMREILGEDVVSSQERKRLLRRAKKLGYVIDPNDTSLTGGVRVTPQMIVDAVKKLPSSNRTVFTAESTDEEILKWLRGE